MSQAVLDRLRVLQEFSRSGGGGELLVRSLDKIISLERERLTAKLEELAEGLRVYEAKYPWTSAVFQEQFLAGTLGDELDFFEWGVLYELWQGTQQRLQILQSIEKL